jgi:hypothetical protein
MDKKTICLNFYAGPGAGKSTIAASVFAELKKKHVNCELITEFAKRKVWEGNMECLNNQLYITAKQQYLMWTVSKHVDLIVTDSPIMLGCIYGNDDLLDQIIIREYHKYNNIDIFLNRNTQYAYQSNGRMQSLDEAIEKDNQICELIKSVNPNYITKTVNDETATEICNYILDTIKEIQ